MIVLLICWHVSTCARNDAIGRSTKRESLTSQKLFRVRGAGFRWAFTVCIFRVPIAHARRKAMISGVRTDVMYPIIVDMYAGSYVTQLWECGRGA